MKDIMVGCETHFFFMEIENELKEILVGYFAESDYKVIESVLRGEKGTKVLEIYVDTKNAVEIDELSRINKDLNELVDKNILLNDLSKLVVSSPGAERPLKFFWQLYKHTGRTVEIILISGDKIEGKLNRVSDMGDEIISLEVMQREKGKKVNMELMELYFKDIKEIKIKISFSKK